MNAVNKCPYCGGELNFANSTTCLSVECCAAYVRDIDARWKAKDEAEARSNNYPGVSGYRHIWLLERWISKLWGARD